MPDEWVELLKATEYRHLDFVDIAALQEGEFVQLSWDRPFDWSIEAPELSMWRDR